MAEGGVMTEEYRHFLNQPSSNMDDSGFFSGNDLLSHPVLKFCKIFPKLHDVKRVAIRPSFPLDPFCSASDQQSPGYLGVGNDSLRQHGFHRRRRQSSAHATNW